MSVIIIIIISLVMVCNCQQQDPVQFLPINNWNCNETEQICAASDPNSELLKTSSVSECAMLCWMKLPDCLQFNYYTESSPPLASSSCALYTFPPKRYVITAACQHYVVNTLCLSQPTSTKFSLGIGQ